MERAGPSRPQWRLCFRLCEPGALALAGGGDAGPWRVALFLQAVGDPSLVVSAAEVWAAGPSIQRAARGRSAPGPFLLAELGRAVRTAPELAGALDVPAPAGFDLDVDGAHEFMTSTAARLVDGGFGVWLPTWWRAAPAMSLRLRTRAVAQAGRAAAGLDVAALCAYDWKVALGGHSISEAELQTVARLKAPIVRWRGQWVEHDPALVERVVQFLADERAAPERTMTAKEAVATAVGARQVLAGVPIEDVEPHRELAPLSPARWVTTSARRQRRRASSGSSPLSAAWAQLAAHHGAAGPRGVLGRRHGPRQNRHRARPRGDGAGGARPSAGANQR